MKQAHEKYTKDGFVVLGFNSDGAVKKMNDYIAEKGSTGSLATRRTSWSAATARSSAGRYGSVTATANS
ncbi:MAG: hypothetical protein ACYTFN_17685 [Planctomycetota bacterium]